MNWIDESVEKLRPQAITYQERWAYIRDVMQPLLDEWYKEFEPALRTALQEARTQGAQEALEKVEEWANTNKRTDDTQMSHDHIYDEALEDLLHHLQQLKDNKA